ncbi:MAG: uncharacterized protein JWN04_6086 [Myxococcaceae bacterium]|nr:uncharacterized protein [Myxococcaceae bacterium]
MTRSLLALCFMLVGASALGCGHHTVSAPKSPTGSPIAIMVHTDERITPDMAPDRVAQINQISEWMENDLISILHGAGYAATRVEDPNTATGPGRLLLRVAITDYNAGSKAARMLVGFGAGAAVLKTHFELFGDASPAPLIGGDPDVGSGRDWRNSARKVNLQTADAVSTRLAQLYTTAQ